MTKFYGDLKLLFLKFSQKIENFWYNFTFKFISGEKNVVGGTPYDFRVPRVLRAMLPKIPMGGYDINYCITQGTEQDLSFLARSVSTLVSLILQ